MEEAIAATFEDEVELDAPPPLSDRPQQGNTKAFRASVDYSSKRPHIVTEKKSSSSKN